MFRYAQPVQNITRTRFPELGLEKQAPSRINHRFRGENAMQAIITKFLGPTNTKGPRIKATSWSDSVTVSYNRALNVLDNHRAAADAVCAKRGDGWRIVANVPTPDGHGYAFTAEYDPE